MIISLDLELKDRPGSLVSALEPISQLGGNIISIVHLREKESFKGERIPVHIKIQVESQGMLDKIIKEIEKRDIWVSKVGEIIKKSELSLIVIGHVVDTDLRDTIDRINELEGVMVIDLDLSMPHPDKRSSAKMDIELMDNRMRENVLARLHEIALEKDLEVITSLEV